jgi:phosphoglycerate kinase
MQIAQKLYQGIEIEGDTVGLITYMRTDGTNLSADAISDFRNFVKKSYAGPLLKKEITAINLIIKNKKEPVTCIIGGSKISTKINVITNLITKVNNLVIVGAMANNFFLYKNLKIGKSLIEENTNKVIEDIYKKVNTVK